MGRPVSRLTDLGAWKRRREARRFEGPGCPETAVLAAYLDGGLQPDDRTAIEAHLTGCEACYTVLVETARATEAVAPALAPGRSRWIAAGIALAAAACLVLAVLVLRGGLGSSRAGGPGTPPELQGLVAALGTERVLVPRVVGGFPYGEPPAPRRAGGGERRPLGHELQVEIGRIRQRALEQPTAANLRALGVAQLVEGDPGGAVASLQQSIESSSPGASDAVTLTDLAAAYLARDRPGDAQRAFDASSSGLNASPRSPEALFDRALAAERLFPEKQVKEAWDAYIAAEPDPRWKAEGRRRLDAFLSSHRGDARPSGGGGAAALGTMSDTSADDARRKIDQQLVPGWADAAVRGDLARARGQLAAAADAAALVAQGHGDDLPLDVVRAISRVSAPDDVRQLAGAHAQFRDGGELYNRDELGRAAALFRSARPVFARFGSPEAGWCRLYEAVDAYFEGDRGRAAGDLAALDVESAAHLYPVLAGRVSWMRGYIAQDRGVLGEALQRFTRALSLFESAGARDETASMQSLLASTLDWAGEYEAAEQHRDRAVAMVSGIRSTRLRVSILSSAARAAMNQGLWATAIAFQTADFDAADAGGLPADAVEALVFRAQLQDGLRIAGAEADLAEARRRVSTLKKDPLSRRLGAEIEAAEAQAGLDRPSQAAVSSLRDAIDAMQHTGSALVLGQLYLALGRRSRASGDTASAETAFAAGIRTIEAQRPSLSQELRVSHLDKSWDVFKEMIRLQVDRGDFVRAFEYAERARARGLRESLHDSGTHTATISDLRARLPTGTALAYFALLDDRVLLWWIARDQFTLFQREIADRSITSEVTQYRRALETARPTGELKERGARLFGTLFGPAMEALGRTSRLIVVPDGILHEVPFASFVDPQSGAYLIERCAIQIAPSATLLLRQDQTPPSRPGLLSAVVVGNPQAGDEASGLPALAGADREARIVGGLYPHSETLIGAEATRSRFLAAVRRREVLHFAGHAVANEEYPLLSRLILAPEAGLAGSESGELFSQDLQPDDFRQVRLVVLAGCRTAVGRIRRGEGVVSLARGFVAAGVPNVVATLWDLDDEAGRELFTEFHRAIVGGATPADALRRAQLRLLRTGAGSLSSPSSWAAVHAIATAVI